jgi:site-specific recombinase XerC
VEQGKARRPEVPFKLNEIWAIRIRLQLANCARDLAMFDLAIDSAPIDPAVRAYRRWPGARDQLGSCYGTYTLRRTKASLNYRRTKNLRAVQLLLGHTKMGSTVRYLGIEVDDALEMVKRREV